MIIRDITRLYREIAFIIELRSWSRSDTGLMIVFHTSDGKVVTELYDKRNSPIALTEICL